MPTGVLMHSISKNNRDVCYYLLVDESFTEDNKNALIRVANKYGNYISFYVVTKEMTKSLPFGRKDQPGHVSIATYYRLFITEILPESVHKIIYLDGDMIVRHSLDDLWNTDIEDFALGVVHDMDELKHRNRLPYPMETGYFNAGMLLINVDYWRNNHCYQQFWDFVENHFDAIKLHDQDVLNCVFYDKKRWVSLTFNFQTGFVYLPNYRQNDESIDPEIDEVKHNPVIIHYSAKIKPWMIECFHPYCHVWRYYWRHSEWKKKRLIGDTPQTLKERVRFFCLRHNLYMPKCEYQKLRLHTR